MSQKAVCIWEAEEQMGCGEGLSSCLLHLSNKMSLTFFPLFSLLPFCFLSSPSPSSSLLLSDHTIMNVSSYKWERLFCWVKRTGLDTSRLGFLFLALPLGCCVILGSWALAGSLLKHRVRLDGAQSPL